VEFLHLRPIGGSGLAGRAKDVWFETVRALAFLTRGRLNLDNLFVVARTQSST
jgi:hypothetical protein